MATVAPTAATWTWPPEVKTLADELRVTAYLQPVYEMTQEVYRKAPLTLQVDEDPEIPNDRRVLFEVDVTGHAGVDQGAATVDLGEDAREAACVDVAGGHDVVEAGQALGG